MAADVSIKMVYRHFKNKGLVAHFTIVVVRTKQASAGERTKEGGDRG